MADIFCFSRNSPTYTSPFFFSLLVATWRSAGLLNNGRTFKIKKNVMDRTVHSPYAVAPIIKCYTTYSYLMICYYVTWGTENKKQLYIKVNMLTMITWYPESTNLTHLTLQSIICVIYLRNHRPSLWGDRLFCSYDTMLTHCQKAPPVIR